MLRSGGHVSSSLHTCSFEIRKAARITLEQRSEGALFGDILSLLPIDLQTWIAAGHRTITDLKRRIIADRPVVARKAFCHRAGHEVQICLGDILVAGIPCVDFSALGLRRGIEGPSGALICSWIRIIQEFQPSVILVEEVPGFAKHGLPFIAAEDALGDLYTFDHAEISPLLLGLPVNRPRVYCIACHR